MAIPDLLKLMGYEFYRPSPMPPEGWPERESPEALRKSLDKAHDNIGQLVLWIRILLAGLAALATAFFSTLAWLIPYAIRGMAK